MRSEEISQFLQERIDANDFPSAVYLVAEKGEIVFQDALGLAVVEPEKIPARHDTVYDLASLTKPLVTGLLAAKLIDDGELRLSDQIGEFLIDFKNEPKSEITLSQLLTHTSGQKAWLPLYLKAASFRSVLKTIAAEPLVWPGGSDVLYSDLNFIAIANIIESIGRSRIDTVAGQEILDPLKLERTTFNPLREDSWVDGLQQFAFAASEKGNEYEKNTCIEQGFLARSGPAKAGVSNFRDYQIWGVVHDGNAWFMGGAAGHAGLFSTVEEVFKIALQFLPAYSKLLRPETCEMFRTNFTKGMNEDRSIAFQLASTKDSTAGAKMSPESFGHLGFTGTSLWIDPVKDRVFILLTNRTHAHPLPFVNINSVRRRFHDIAIGLLDKNK